MSDIFREVDEALQQEKLEKIWKEYSSTIIAAIIILLLSAGGTSSYHSWNNSRNATETAKLMTALDSAEPNLALKEVIEDSRKGHEATAAMIAAGQMLEEGKTDEAALLYKKIADTSGTPKDLRDLARILYIRNSDAAEIDLLKPILANEKSPWIWHARIEAAVLHAGKQDYANAVTYLETFKSAANTVPLALKKRGQALLHVYMIKAQKEGDAS